MALQLHFRECLANDMHPLLKFNWNEHELNLIQVSDSKSNNVQGKAITYAMQYLDYNRYIKLIKCSVSIQKIIN